MGFFKNILIEKEFSIQRARDSYHGMVREGLIGRKCEKCGRPLKICLDKETGVYFIGCRGRAYLEPCDFRQDFY